MKIKKRKCYFITLVLMALVIIVACNCSSDVKVDSNKFNLITMAAMNADSWPMPKLSEKEASLVDSISRLDAFINYHNAYQQLIKKTSSYFANLGSEEIEEFTQNGTDTAFISDFMKKMNSCINIEIEIKAVEEAGKDFDKMIKGLELTEAERIALIIKKFK